MTETKFTRDALTKHVTALDDTIALVTEMTRESLDPAALHKVALEASERAHIALLDAKKLLSAAFAAVGVRPV